MKIKSDEHTHPNVLKRPDQALEFISRALELGFQKIVFTDHMPFSYTGDEVDRIPFGEVGKYCEKVAELADEYKDKIIIETGIEIDYGPDCIDEIENVLSAGKFDVISGSSHLSIPGFGIHHNEISENEYAEINIRNYIEAAKSGYFTKITHLDFYRWSFADHWFDYKEKNYSVEKCRYLLEELFETVEDTGVDFELNAAPLYRQFDDKGFYPSYEIMEIAKKYNIKYVYGSDAHESQYVGFGYDEIEPYITR